MSQPILRLLIRENIASGRLPQDRLLHMWGGSGAGETCDGCGEIVTRAQKVMDVLDVTGCEVRFHVACFLVWEVERQCMNGAAHLQAAMPSRVN
jgi:hypothetical protein